MAYDTEFPPTLKVPCDSGGSLYIYVSSVDSILTISSDGYFSNVRLMGMEIGDVIFILDGNNLSSIYQISSFTGNAANTSAVSAGSGGGGGISSSQTISSGLTASASFNQLTIWNSATVGPKILSAPAATGSFKKVGSIDMYGSATSDNPITFTPNGGDVVIGIQNKIYTAYGSAEWQDVAVGVWANM